MKDMHGYWHLHCRFTSMTHVWVWWDQWAQSVVYILQLWMKEKRLKSGLKAAVVLTIKAEGTVCIPPQWNIVPPACRASLALFSDNPFNMRTFAAASPHPAAPPWINWWPPVPDASALTDCLAGPPCPQKTPDRLKSGLRWMLTGRDKYPHSLILCLNCIYFTARWY